MLVVIELEFEPVVTLIYLEADVATNFLQNGGERDIEGIFTIFIYFLIDIDTPLHLVLLDPENDISE